MKEYGKPGFIEKMIVACTAGAAVGAVSGITDAPEEARIMLTDTVVDLALKGDEWLHEKKMQNQMNWMNDILNQR